jgi:hypothetical protein
MAKHIPHRVKSSEVEKKDPYKVYTHSLDPKHFTWNHNHKKCYGTGILGFNVTHNELDICKCVRLIKQETPPNDSKIDKAGSG